MRIKAMADYLERENKKTVQMCCTCRPICTCCPHIAPHRFMFFFFSFSFSTFILCILVVCCLNALVHSCHCWLRLFIAFPIRSNLPVRKEERNVFFSRNQQTAMAGGIDHSQRLLLSLGQWNGQMHLLVGTEH